VRDYLSLLWPDRSQRTVQKLLAGGRIRSAGKPVGADRRVGDLPDLFLAGGTEGIETIAGSSPSRDASRDERLETPGILHEDSRLIVLAKPSGLPVVPDRRRSEESCLGFLIRRELEARMAKPPAAYIRPRIVHRLDRLTSGLLMVAKTPDVERNISADLENRRVRKEYLALLDGVMEPAGLAVNCPVVPGRKGKMRARPTGGREDWRREGEARTEFQVLERFDVFTLVRARPLTGRTHQIRVHAWVAGHPLAIDPIYGRSAGGAPAREVPGIQRLTLHALRYELPESWDEPRAFECPLPRDFEAALERLRAESRGR
jgi:23S rRNA pseudouridine1911/1915/1917 synthase